MSSTSYSNEGSTIAPASGPDKQESRTSSLLPLTPGQPPVAVSGKGIYITLEDGREFIDAAGGVAVACIGNGHPIVREAVKEQVDKLACDSLSNEPAEELASVLLESGKGAFELCGFAAGDTVWTCMELEGVCRAIPAFWEIRQFDTASASVYWPHSISGAAEKAMHSLDVEMTPPKLDSMELCYDRSARSRSHEMYSYYTLFD
ncbi:hypothetical protein EDB84DRAFT_1682189 [Lactarius hengduanensis]|nr:hypothetical protein EDB84DRAFT_1682189 [Lactarius hengduanensis]